MGMTKNGDPACEHGYFGGINCDICDVCPTCGKGDCSHPWHGLPLKPIAPKPSDTGEEK